MSLGTAWRVLSAEGWRAVRDRALDRLAEERRRRTYRPAPDSWRGDVPVLTVSAFPPEARFGGVQAQWAARIPGEEALGPAARLYPVRSGWHLEISTGPGGERQALRHAGFGPPPGPRDLRHPGFEAAVAWAVERVGARALHVEGAAGLPPESLLRITGGNLTLLLALHDFALYCPRPHLLEEPSRRFCGYCRDLDRCAACLGEGPAFVARWRQMGGALLAAAGAAVFPSPFLARTYGELFGPLPGGRCRVIPPSPPPSLLLPQRPAAAPRHVALVGGVQAHKGAAVFADLIERRNAAGADPRWSAYGGGDPALLARLRAAGVRVRGFYRAGTLPALLHRDGVELALLPSVVPESFSLVLSECRAAGVPVLAFDLGAIGERLRAEGGGLTVPLEAGAAGLAAVLAEVLAGRREIPSLALPATTPSSQLWRDLYRQMGLA